MIVNIVRMKKLKFFICMFWLFLIIIIVAWSDPCPPRISSHPWSVDFIKFVANIIDILVSGWVEVGAKNHIVVIKNFVLFVFLIKNSGSHKINAVISPSIITVIVSSLSLIGKMNVCGLNGRAIDWSIDPARIAVKARIVVAQLV